MLPDAKVRPCNNRTLGGVDHVVTALELAVTLSGVGGSVTQELSKSKSTTVTYYRVGAKKAFLCGKAAPPLKDGRAIEVS